MKKTKYDQLIAKSGTVWEFERACRKASNDLMITDDEADKAVKKYCRDLQMARREDQCSKLKEGVDFNTMFWQDFMQFRPKVDGRYMIQDWLGFTALATWYVDAGWSLYRPAAVIYWFDFLPPELPDVPAEVKLSRSNLLELCQDEEITALKKLYPTFKYPRKD